MELILSSKVIPDQNGPQTPGMNNLLLDTAMWQVEVPQTKTMRRHIASSSKAGQKYFVKTKKITEITG